MSNNKTTLISYEENLQAYLDATPSEVKGDFKKIIDSTLELIPKESAILELGSGTGRDADYIDSLGYKVTRTDAADSFIAYQKTKGKKINKLNLLNFSLSKNYDLIFANAVLLHFTKHEFITILTQLKKHLNLNGYLVFSVKKGQDEKWSSHKLNAKRFYKLWSQKEMNTILNSLNFEIITTSELQNGKWLFFIAQPKYESSNI